MNAIPQKPFEADPAISRGSASPASDGGENVRLTIDFEDEPEDAGSTAARAPGADDEGIDTPGSATAAATRKAGEAVGAYQADTARPGATEAQSRGSAAGEPAHASAARRRTPPPVADPSAAPALSVPPQLAGIEVTLTVEIGSHRLPLKDLLSIDPGQLFALDRMTSDPVSILVNGKPFAQGEIVAIGDRFGVRLLDIVEPEES